jgi:hypothetical protein
MIVTRECIIECRSTRKRTHLTFDMVFDVPSNTITSHTSPDDDPPSEDGSSSSSPTGRWLRIRPKRDSAASVADAAANMPLAPPPMMAILRRRLPIDPSPSRL